MTLLKEKRKKAQSQRVLTSLLSQPIDFPIDMLLSEPQTCSNLKLIFQNAAVFIHHYLYKKKYGTLPELKKCLLPEWINIISL